ncbi:MAG: 50S ribosomal protein L19 [Waddliaceae bacterium]|jgi:large subunit ribosomal protein L19|nr:50S ribosomal protein L19 [Waddliaceae bacterium]MBT3579187.1 50S ribosomal protein L19 [Waddliaceae bacterium]MBT4444753.1 50S ribosomal protein L19 [Waddliaceae bacterium]MBT6928887.1 50S ribosomal protein L19 [Waddliaceae bacterium]MBT7264135.1 50S ribosomal protein L19 [Waddliaceae bacterium]
MKNILIESIEKEQLRDDIPEFNVGDTISVHYRIIEGAKERKQIFTGTVIARKGRGLSETVSIHRIAYGEGMERLFLINSPRIAKIEVTRKGKVRRSKLYHLRGSYGKASKVKGLMEGRRKKTTTKKDEAVEAVSVEETTVDAKE